MYSNKLCAVAMIFIVPQHVEYIKSIFEWILSEYNFSIIGWRKVPVNSIVLGQNAAVNEPYVIQCLVQSDIVKENEI